MARRVVDKSDVAAFALLLAIFEGVVPRLLRRSFAGDPAERPVMRDSKCLMRRTGQIRLKSGETILAQLRWLRKVG
jgi:hypothetical protein